MDDYKIHIIIENKPMAINIEKMNKIFSAFYVMNWLLKDNYITLNECETIQCIIRKYLDDYINLCEEKLK